MIYFDSETSQKVMSHFEDSLVEGGWLVLGHAEQLSDPRPSLKGTQFPSALIYEKASLPGCAASPPRAAAPDPVFRFEAAPGAKPADPEPIVRIEDVRELADRGEFAQAVTVCERLIGEGKLSPSGYFYYALVLEQIGRHVEAEQVLKKVIQTDRSFALGHYYLGLLHWRQREQEKARVFFREAQDALSGRPDTEIFADGDGISVRELRGLIETYLRA
jgi:chemotaxis protein methyltransferase CheR